MRNYSKCYQDWCVDFVFKIFEYISNYGTDGIFME